jgi:hypothetical protein
MNININVDDVDLKSVIADKGRYDDEEGWIAGEVYLGNEIARLLVDRILADKTYGEQLGQRVRAIRDEEIRAAIAPAIADAVAAPIQQSNAYGEPTGKATTLREIIAADARKYLTEPADQYYRDRGSRLDRMVREAVAAAFQAELAAQVKEVRDAVLAEAGDLIGTQVQDAIRAALGAKAATK